MIFVSILRGLYVAGELRYQAEDSDSTHILTDVQFTEKVKRAVASLNMKKTLPWGESDVILAMSPITHMSGFFGLVSVLNGTTSVITSSTMTPSEIIDTVDKYQLQALVREMKLTGRTLPTMREMVVGGSVVQETLTKAAREAFGRRPESS
ncbi:hypothetical protein HPB48_001991 [Haemaphysalis longicornis]|uniref:Uncharacterized protein n=1 Tax=Haemaphysalis longicornis TaxID=44386 RepID=A0A9J6GA62_HAELO|nr:hypothetical protein HPB48_001991 [Haemaphysalis longicornis]